MVQPYGFATIDAGQPIERIFRELQRHMSRLRLMRAPRRKPVLQRVKA